jgi:DNA-binding response OmpR family regulator
MSYPMAIQSGGEMMKNPLDMRRDERPDLRKALETASFLVFDVSERGRELERLREFWAAFFLLDLALPRMRGLEVLRRLRGAGADDPEVIVLIQGRALDAVAAVRLGTLDVLARPLAPEALHGAIEGIVRRASGPRPRILVAVDPLLFILLRAKRALDRREFDDARRLLRGVIDVDPLSAVAHNLMGVLHESLGEHHASYHAFRAALRADRHYRPALENLRRYCERFGLDLHDSTFNSLDGRGDPPSHLGRASA